MDLVTQNKQTVHCEVLTEIGHTVENSSGHSDREPTDDKCKVLTDIRSGQSEGGKQWSTFSLKYHNAA